MELIWMPVIGAGIGFLLRYVIAGREHYGLLLNPALAACATAIVWTVLYQSKWSLDAPWIWIVSLIAAAVVGTIVPLVLRRTRPVNDEKKLQSLLTPSV